MRTITLVLAVMSSGAVMTSTHGQDAFSLSLNHISAIVDNETAQAIEASDFLRAFSAFEVRTVSAGEERWRGRYLMGRSTYLEVFATADLPGPPEGRRRGRTSIALGTDVLGSIERFDGRLRDAGIATEKRTRRLQLDERPVDTSTRVRVEPAAHGFDPPQFFYLRAIEYLPGYFEATESEPPVHANDVSRERYLPDAYENALMRDISRLVAAVPRAEFTLAAPLLVAAGFDVRWTDDGAIASGADFAIELEFTEEARAGLRRVEFLLNQSMETSRTERIGVTTLTVGPGSRAVWQF